jgi:hypothetical protein
MTVVIQSAAVQKLSISNNYDLSHTAINRNPIMLHASDNTFIHHESTVLTYAEKMHFKILT